MNGETPNIFFIICWKYLAPTSIFVICLLNWSSYSAVTYGDYTLPTFAQTFGWVVALISIIAIPLGAVHSVLKAKGTTLLEVYSLNIS